MTTSTNAILFFGLAWETESSRPPRKDASEDEEEDPDEDWEEQYALLKGLTRPSEPFPTGTRKDFRSGETYTEAETLVLEKFRSYWAKKNALTEAEPCTIGTHCHSECPMPFVAIKASMRTAHRGDIVSVSSLTVGDDWYNYLMEFCHLMGIDTSDVKPGWFLVSYWG